MKYIQINKAVAVMALAGFLLISNSALAYSAPVFADGTVNTPDVNQTETYQYPTPSTSYSYNPTTYPQTEVLPYQGYNPSYTPQYIPQVAPIYYNAPVIPDAPSYVPGNQTQQYNQLAVTTVGSNTVTANGVHLVGSWTSAGASQVSTWFQYGTTQGNLSNSTTPRYHNLSNGSFTESVSGLLPNTTYYYRAAAQSNGSAVYGTINAFTTSAQVLGTSSKATLVRTIQSTNTNALASSESANVCSGDTINYTLNYANTTNGTITNAVLLVTLPPQIEYAQSTATATYNNSNRTVTVFIGTVAKGQSGTVYLQGTANSQANGVQTIATRVDFTFTQADGTNATTTSYVMHSGLSCGNSLGANALGAGFLPTSFAGWVLLIVLICAIIFITRKYFGKKKEEHGHGHGVPLTEEHQEH